MVNIRKRNNSVQICPKKGSGFMNAKDPIYTLAICDSDKQFRKNLIQIITQNMDCPKRILLLEYDTSKELLADTNQHPDLIFIDTGLGGTKGFKIIEKIRKNNEDSIIVICTTERYPVPDLFKVQPFRYFRKNKNLLEINKEMSAVMKEVKKKAKAIFYVEGGKRKVYIDDICYIAKVKRSCEIVFQDGGRCVTRNTLVSFYDALYDKAFEYAHNSYIVNLRCVENLDTTTVTLTDNTVLCLSRTKKTNFKKRLRHYQRNLFEGIRI